MVFNELNHVKLVQQLEQLKQQQQQQQQAANANSNGGVEHQASPMLNDIDCLPPETDHEGNVEYKQQLLGISAERLKHLTTQLKWRLAEGDGEAIYNIGVADNGTFVGLTDDEFNETVQTLMTMATALDAEVYAMYDREVPPTHRNDLIKNGSEANSEMTDNAPRLRVAEIRIRSRFTDSGNLRLADVRVAIIGDHFVGKSTLLGCLMHDVTDNGRGLARLNLLRHRHEIETGRTSSISYGIIGFDESDSLVNYGSSGISSWEQICANSSRVVTFLDTCGHPKYARTTIRGLTGKAPDFACLAVPGDSGRVSEMTREYLVLAHVLELRTFVVLTKMDLATKDTFKRVIGCLHVLFKRNLPNSAPVIVQSKTDINQVVKKFLAGEVVPIFLVSNVTAENHAVLRRFLGALRKPDPSIDDADSAADVGTPASTSTSLSPNPNVSASSEPAPAPAPAPPAPVTLESAPVQAPVSALTSPNLRNLTASMHKLVRSPSWRDQPVEFQIEEYWMLPDVGCVVGGRLLTGRIELNITDPSQNVFMLGPGSNGEFGQVLIATIHHHRIRTHALYPGQSASLALRTLDDPLARNGVASVEDIERATSVKMRKGLVVLSKEVDTRQSVAMEFEVDMVVLFRDGVIRAPFQGVVHCGASRQAANITHIELPQAQREAFSAAPSPIVPTAQSRPSQQQQQQQQQTTTQQTITQQHTVVVGKDKARLLPAVISGAPGSPGLNYASASPVFSTIGMTITDVNNNNNSNNNGGNGNNHDDVPDKRRRLTTSAATPAGSATATSALGTEPTTAGTSSNRIRAQSRAPRSSHREVNLRRRAASNTDYMRRRADNADVDVNDDVNDDDVDGEDGDGDANQDDGSDRRGNGRTFARAGLGIGRSVSPSRLPRINETPRSHSEGLSTARDLNGSEWHGSLAAMIPSLRTGDRAMVRLRFTQYPEYLRRGAVVLFRDGRTKCVGKVVGIVPV